MSLSRRYHGAQVWLRLLRVTMTTGPTWWGGLVSAVISAGLGLYVDVSDLLPGLADPLNLCLSAVAFIAPIGAGSAAAAAVAFGRSGTGGLALTTPRGRREALWLNYVAVAAWHLLAFALLVGTVLARSDLAGPWTAPMWLLPLSGISTILAAVAIGFAVGVRWLHGGAVAASVGVVFAWVYVGALLPEPARHLSPVFPDVFYQNYFQPDPTLVTAQALSMGALALLAALVAGVLRRRVAAAATIAAIAAGMVAASQTSGAAVSFRDPPADPPCYTQEHTQLCTWPESGRQARVGLAAIVHVRNSVAGLLDTPSRYREPGLLSVPGRTAQLPSTTGDDPVFLAVIAITPRPACPSPTSTAQSAQDQLGGWIQARAAPSTITNAHIVQLLGEPAAAQREWVARQLAALRACKR